MSDLTWCSQRQARVRVPGLCGNEEVAEDAYSYEKGQKNNSSYGQTHEGPYTVPEKVCVCVCE